MNNWTGRIHYSASGAAALAQDLGRLVQQATPSQVLVAADANVLALHGELLATVLPGAPVFAVPSGEAHKNLDTVQRLWQWLLHSGADRHSLVVAIGGGVTTDLVAWAASSWLRGVRFVLVPTTLLAMADAAVGGKTGIDFGGGKNLVGSFAQPEAIVIWHGFLATLPPRELLAGYAEVLKHALIHEAALWQHFAATPYTQINLAEVARHGVRIKAEIVEQDPYEKGPRKLLNFGHTIGHALESVCLATAQPLLHGEAVALGMCAEALLSRQYAGLAADDCQQILETIYRQGYTLPAQLPAPDTLLPYLKLDKKNRDGTLRFVLLEEIGRGVYDIAVPPDAALQAWEDTVQWFSANDRR